MVQKIEKTILCQQINDHNIGNVNRNSEVYILNFATHYNYHRIRSHYLNYIDSELRDLIFLLRLCAAYAPVSAAKNKGCKWIGMSANMFVKRASNIEMAIRIEKSYSKKKPLASTCPWLCQVRGPISRPC